MDIEFQLERPDYGEFLKLAYSRMSRIGKGNKKFFLLNMVAWVFIGIAVTGAFRFYEVYDGIDFMYLNLALLFLGLSVIWLFGVTVYQRKFYTRYAINEHGHLLKHQKARLTDTAIIISTSETEQSYSWVAIQGVEESNNLVCLFIDNGQALIFPKRAFRNEAQIEECRSLVQTKIGSNHQVNLDASR